VSVQHPGVAEWEARLKAVFDRIDDHLEEKYGTRYPLHPNRASRGQTSNKEQDGLFDVGAAFTAGFGSERGRGYVVETRMVTLDPVPDQVRSEIHREVVTMLANELSREFPERELSVEQDGDIFKITGDLSL